MKLLTIRGRRPTAYGAVMVGAVALGCVLRVACWHQAGSLTTDELFIALNLRSRSFLELRGHLTYDQIAPLGWLWLHRLVYLVGGAGDATLRLPALLAACGGLVATAALAHRVLSRAFALLGTVLVTGAPWLIYYGAQVKQYAFEAALSPALVLLGVLAVRSATRRRTLAFWATAGVAAWFGAATAFTAGTVGLLIGGAALARRAPTARWHVVGAVAWLGSLASLWSFQRPFVAGWVNGWWLAVHPGSMAPQPLSLGTWTAWAWQALPHLATTALRADPAFAGWVGVSVAAGAIALGLRHRLVGLVVCAPLVAALVLAGMSIYPLSGRVAVWTVPTVLLLACAAPDAAWRAVSPLLRRGAVPAPRLAAGTALITLWAAAGVGFAATVARPTDGTIMVAYGQGAQALRFVARRQGPQDVVFMRMTLAPLARWYARDIGLRWHGQYTTAPARRCRHAPQHPLLRTAHRIWLVLRLGPTAQADQLAGIRALLGRYGPEPRTYVFGQILVATVITRPRPPGVPVQRCLSLHDPATVMPYEGEPPGIPAPPRAPATPDRR